MTTNSQFEVLQKTIESLNTNKIPDQRKEVLAPLILYIKNKVAKKEAIALNFICTHNSRRSHLSQVWAQTLAHHVGINTLTSYSGGTEATALFPMAAHTLEEMGLQVHQLSEGNNPVYSIKYAANAHPLIGFSKKFDDVFNPQANFAAIMTCSSADQGCPIVLGSEARFPITYEDPKAFDDTPLQEEKYKERSLQIATELLYVMQQSSSQN